jgi:hypothetical protein
VATLSNRRGAEDTEVSAEGLCAFHFMPEKGTGKAKDYINDEFDE